LGAALGGRARAELALPFAAGALLGGPMAHTALPALIFGPGYWWALGLAGGGAAELAFTVRDLKLGKSLSRADGGVEIAAMLPVLALGLFTATFPMRGGTLGMNATALETVGGIEATWAVGLIAHGAWAAVHGRRQTEPQLHASRWQGWRVSPTVMYEAFSPYRGAGISVSGSF